MKRPCLLRWLSILFLLLWYCTVVYNVNAQATMVCFWMVYVIMYEKTGTNQCMDNRATQTENVK